MGRNAQKSLTSKEVLERIGITDRQLESSFPLIDDDEEGLNGDLVPLLRERYRQLKEMRYDLMPGMIVRWKAGLKNRSWPHDGAPAIVIERLDPPIYDNDDSGSTYFRERLDMIVGLFVDSGEHDGDFLVFHANSERYQPWQSDELES